MEQTIPTLKQLNWALEKVTGTPRPSDQSLSAEDIQILRSGKYTNPKGAVATFGLPDTWDTKKALDALETNDAP